MLRLTRPLVIGVAVMTSAVVTFAAPTVSAGHPPVTSSSATYTVVAGDYLSGIAVKLKVSLRDLLNTNSLRLDSLIYPGMVLQVPAGGSQPIAAADPSTGSTGGAYVVVKGDYLSGIAVKLNVTLRSLLTTNGLTIASVIQPGQKLTVPAGGSLPAATPRPVSQSPAPAAAPAQVQVYTVVSGDALSTIAQRLGVTTRSILDLNGLRLDSLIWPGMKLNVPAGAQLPVASPTASSSKVQTVIDYALAQVGKPYKFFTAGPETFDCSGLTKRAFAQIGVNLPHYSVAQATHGTAVDWRNGATIKPGDLVFLSEDGVSQVIMHVGIALSSTTWVEATRSGDVVKTGNIPMRRVVAVRRVVEG
jgi:LysM repeat protein